LDTGTRIVKGKLCSFPKPSGPSIREKNVATITATNPQEAEIPPIKQTRFQREEKSRYRRTGLVRIERASEGGETMPRGPGGGKKVGAGTGRGGAGRH